MTNGTESGEVFQLPPTPADIAAFAATGTPYSKYFRQDDGYPLVFPGLKPNEHFVFDYPYESEKTGETKTDCVIVTSLEQMRSYHAGVKLGLLGVIGWRVVAEPEFE